MRRQQGVHLFVNQQTPHLHSVHAVRPNGARQLASTSVRCVDTGPCGVVAGPHHHWRAAALRTEHRRRRGIGSVVATRMLLIRAGPRRAEVPGGAWAIAAAVLQTLCSPSPVGTEGTTKTASRFNYTYSHRPTQIPITYSLPTLFTHQGTAKASGRTGQGNAAKAPESRRARRHARPSVHVRVIVCGEVDSHLPRKSGDGRRAADRTVHVRAAARELRRRSGVGEAVVPR